MYPMWTWVSCEHQLQQVHISLSYSNILCKYVEATTKAERCYKVLSFVITKVHTLSVAIKGR